MEDPTKSKHKTGSSYSGIEDSSVNFKQGKNRLEDSHGTLSALKNTSLISLQLRLYSTKPAGGHVMRVPYVIF